MDAVQRIAQAIMQGQGNAPQQASVPQITPWDLQRLADAQRRGASPGVPSPAPAANPAGGPTGGFAPPEVAANTAQTAVTMPPTTVAASPLPPQGDAVAQTPPPLPPSIAIGPERGAGMAQVPQTQQQLSDWQKLMETLRNGGNSGLVPPEWTRNFGNRGDQGF